MEASTLYGSCLLASGWLAARAVTVARRDRVRRRLHDRPSPPIGAARRRGGAPRPQAMIAAAAAGAAVAGFVWLGPVGGVLGGLAPVALARALRSRRHARVALAAEGQLRDAVVALAAGLRAGLSIRIAVAEASRDAEPPLADALGAVLRRLDLGESLDVALERLLPELAAPDTALVVNVLRVHRRTGGDLPALLDRVAEVIGDRVDERRHLRALTAQATASGVVLAALPVAFVALLSGAGGDGLGAFYRTPMGGALLAAGAALDAAGFAWMRRIVRGVEAAG